MPANPRPNPYVGPRAFETGETLYGRDREVSELFNLMVAERIVLLYSPSGAGKSSLVRAGLVPKLREEDFLVLPVARVNHEPPDELRQNPGFNRYAFSVLSSFEDSLEEDQRLSPGEMAGLSIEFYLDRLPDRLPKATSEDEIQANLEVLILDQFEEVLTIDPTDREGKQVFFSQLGAALRNRHRWALFAMREDYIGALEPYQRPVPTRFANTYRLDLLGFQASKEAIQNPPYQQYQVKFEDAAADQLVNDLRRVQVQRPDGKIELQPGPYIEPVQLQVVCYRLWEGLAEADMAITTQNLAQVGDVNQSLSDYYAERVMEIAEETGASQRRIRKWFQERLITETGIRGQVLMGAERSEGLENTAIRALEDAHLVRSEKRRGATWYELAHDRLLEPVRTNNEAWFVANLSVLQRQAALWQKENRPDRLLMGGSALSEAEKWAEGHPGRLELVEEEFLQACRAARYEEQKQREQQAQLVKLEEQARLAGQLRRRFVIAVIAAVAALAFAGAALFSGMSAIQASNEAIANAALAKTAEAEAIANAGMAARNAEAAAQSEGLARTQEAIAVFSAATAQASSARAEAQSRQAESARATAEAASALAEASRLEAETNEQLAVSRQLAAKAQAYLGDDRLDLAALLGVEAWHIGDTVEARSVLLSTIQRSLAQTFVPYGGQIPRDRSSLFSVAFSPTDQRLAWGTIDGAIVLWDYGKMQLIERWPGHDNSILTLAFSPDGRWLASGGKDSRLLIWDTQAVDISASGRQITGATNTVFSVVFNSDGTRLAAAYGSRASVWDLTQENIIRVVNIPQQIASVAEIDWSPDDELLVTAGFDRQVQIWSASDGTLKSSHRRHTDVALYVLFSPDGKVVASAGEDRRVILWEYATNTFLSEPINANNNRFINTLAFSPDGRVLASGGEDLTVALIDTSTYKVVGRLENYFKSTVRSLAFKNEKGINLLASVGLDNMIGLHEVRLQQPLANELLSVNSRWLIYGLAGQDGAYRVAYVAGQQVQVLDSDTPNQVFYNAPSNPSTTALSKDGRYMALGYGDGSLRVIDLETKQPIYSASLAGLRWRALAFNWDATQLAGAACTETVEGETALRCNAHEVQIWNLKANNESIRFLVDEYARSFRTRGTPVGHTDYIDSLAFDPSGQFLATAGRDGQVIQWPLTSDLPRIVPFQSRTPVTSLAYSPDGALLAAGLVTGDLQLWQAASGQPVGEALRGLGGSTNALLFESNDALISASGALINRWRVSPALWVEQACQIAGRNLTREEVRQFFSTSRESKTCEQYP